MNKRRILLTLVACLPLLLTAQTTPTKFFKGTFSQALSQAKEQGKKVMVDCYTLWCGPCHYMSTNVFPNDTLGAYLNERFVCMKLDMEHGEGPDRAKEFKVKAYPTFIYFDADGKELNRFEGMCQKDEFIKRSQRILDGKAPIDPEEQPKEGSTVKPKDNPDDKVRDEGKGVKFMSGSSVSYADILAQARRENKRIFIDFWADWCHACKNMDKTTLRDTRIGDLLNLTFVNYSVNMDTDADAKALLDTFKVTAFPTYLILNPDGTEHNRIIGSRTVTGFAEAVTNALMGKEDQYVRMDRLQKEQEAKQRAERQANLTDKATVPQTKVRFEKTSSVASALKKAKKLNRNVVFFVCDGDYKSDYMTKFSLNDQASADYLNSTFVNVYVDAKSKEGDAIITKYGVEERFPGVLMLDKDGNSKGYLPGLMKNVDTLKEYLGYLINPKHSK